MLCGLAVLLIPSYIDVHTVFWRFERGAQSPIILALVVACVPLIRWILRSRMLLPGGGIDQ